LVRSCNGHGRATATHQVKRKVGAAALDVSLIRFDLTSDFRRDAAAHDVHISRKTYSYSQESEALEVAWDTKAMIDAERLFYHHL
jgi:hypothetical protein